MSTSYTQKHLSIIVCVVVLTPLGIAASCRIVLLLSFLYYPPQEGDELQKEMDEQEEVSEPVCAKEGLLTVALYTMQLS